MLSLICELYIHVERKHKLPEYNKANEMTKGLQKNFLFIFKNKVLKRV